jgi:hypothetical protein
MLRSTQTLLRALVGTALVVELTLATPRLWSTPAFAQPVSSPADPQVADDTLDTWVSKTNAYTELLNTSLRAVSAWSRYGSWADLKKGPTGKERIIYGLYEVSPDLAQRALAASDRAREGEPKIPRLDEAARDYARAFEAVIPVGNEASRYYERQDYKDDGMAKGREMHGRLVAVFEPFLAKRAVFEAELKAVKKVVNQRQLEAIERREGKSYAWHVRNVMNSAEPLGDLVQQEPSRELLKELDQRIAGFAEAVRGFDDYLGSPGAQKGKGAFDSTPRSFLGQVREYREELGSRPSSARSKLQFLVLHYNNMIGAANLESRLSR